MKRVGYIDVMKGIAIMSVLVGHYATLRSVGTAIWSFHMPLFIGEMLLFFVLKIQKKAYQLMCVAGLLMIACIQTACVCIPFGINYGCAFLGWLYIGYLFRKHKLFDKLDDSIIVKVIAVVI